MLQGWGFFSTLVQKAEESELALKSAVKANIEKTKKALS